MMATAPCRRSTITAASRLTDAHGAAADGSRPLCRCAEAGTGAMLDLFSNPVILILAAFVMAAHGLRSP
jgi:hypothetical protein